MTVENINDIHDMRLQFCADPISNDKTIKWASPYLKNIMDSDCMTDDNILSFARSISLLRSGVINKKQFDKLVNTYIVKHSKDDGLVVFANTKYGIKCVSRSRAEEIGRIVKHSCGSHAFRGDIAFTFHKESDVQHTNTVLNSLKEEFFEIYKKIEVLNAEGIDID